MHDHIVEMGKNITRRPHPDKPNKHSRLWINTEIADILTNDLGSAAIRYIRLHTEKLSPEVVMKGLRKMKELKFLQVYVENLDASKIECSSRSWKANKFPNALRYLCWKRYPFRVLPDTFQANNLVTLYLNKSTIVQLWEGGEKKVLDKLRFLNLSRSKLKTLDLGSAPNLELLDLEVCSDLVELRMPGRSPNLRSLKVSYSKLRTFDLGSAPNLELIDLEGCSDLVELQMSGRSPNLRSLKLTDSKIRTLDIGLTPNLEELHLENCNDMGELYTGGQCLEKLVSFDISGCLRFKEFQFLAGKSSAIDSSSSEDESLEDGPLAELHLIAEALDECPLHPDNILPKFQFICSYEEDRPLLTRNIEKLISFGLCACTNLDMLSLSICGLQLLRKLKLEGGIPEAPKDLYQLECLEKLEFSETNINHLPDNICMLNHLKYLHLNRCSLLEWLPQDLGQLECLKELSLSSAKIKYLPDSICMLKHLESLKLMDCSLLEKLPKDLGLLESLKKLRSSNVEIKDLPDSLCDLKHLELFELKHCANLEKLPEDIGRLECLRDLKLSFAKIKDLPDSICMLKNLESLILENCSLLEKLPEDLGRLDCLRNLNLYSTKIKDLPDSICMLKNLVSLGLRKCPFLEKLPEDFDRLESLEKLNLSFCKLLQGIPDSICKMKSLRRLTLMKCELERLPEELGRLKCLKFLDLRGTRISHLPESILSLEGLCITAQEWHLELSSQHCYVWVSRDDLERLRRPGVERQI